MKTLGGSAGYKPAEVGIPGLRRDLVRTLKGQLAFGTVVAPLRRQQVGVENALAEQCLHPARNDCTLVVARRSKSDDRPLLDRRQRIGQRRTLLIHAEPSPDRVGETHGYWKTPPRWLIFFIKQAVILRRRTWIKRSA